MSKSRQRGRIYCKALPVYECAMNFGGRDKFQSTNRALWMLVLTVTRLRILDQDR